MAAPAVTRLVTIGFRDARGNTSRTSVIIGAATNAALDTAVATWGTVVAACTNANAYFIQDASPLDKRGYGTAANYQNVEDKMSLTFTSSTGTLHRYRIAAPKTTNFQADQESVNQADANVNPLLVFMSANCYGLPSDTSPLVFVAGTRTRVKTHRKVTAFTKTPDLGGPEE